MPGVTHTVNQEHDLVHKFEGHRIKLSSYIQSPHLLTRHNKGAANITILDEALSVWYLELLGQLKSSDSAGVRNLA